MKVGIDIVDVKRFKNKDDKFFEKLFTINEILYCKSFSSPLEHFAGFFAVKEAMMKALGYGIGKIEFYEIEVLHNTDKKPYVKLLGKAQKIFNNLPEKNIEISISHTKTTATAIAIIM